jgi:hypothetical protein
MHFRISAADGRPRATSSPVTNTYEQVQISQAAKGAEAQSPGVTLSYVIKSGGNDRF